MRENQGLQIALILFVFVVVALSITTYYFWQLYDSTYKEMKTAQQNAANAANAQRAKGQTLKGIQSYLIGDIEEIDDAGDLDLTRDDGLIAYVKAKFDERKALLGNAYTGEENFPAIVDYLHGHIPTLEAQIAEARKAQELAELDKNEAIARESSTRKTAVTDLASIKTDYKTFTDDFGKVQKEVRDSSQTVKTKMAAAEQKFQKELASRDETIALLQTERNNLRTTLDALQAKVTALSKPVDRVDSPDGKITWVNQSDGTVWINLGSQSGLHRQVTFSVFGRDENNVATATNKGKIEVVDIRDDRTAIARILEDDSKNPILTGDIIYSPVWDPGQQLRFAIAGVIDITDAENKKDLQLVQDLIALNGGKIDAMATEGGLSGNLSYNTRYLIVGERPTDKSDEALRNAYGTMLDKAQQYGIQTMSVQKFLDMMGYRPGEQTVPYGRGGAEAQRRSDGFRERRPPAAGRRSAF